MLLHFYQTQVNTKHLYNIDIVQHCINDIQMFLFTGMVPVLHLLTCYDDSCCEDH